MPIVPVSAPQTIGPAGGFDYVTVDAQRRRVYAAHAGAKSLVVIDADTGAPLTQILVGPMHGVAVNEATGHVYTGNGDDRSVSEVDPVAKTVLRTVKTGGNVDAIAYDPKLDRIYADEDDGTHVYVIDAKTFTLIKSITLPGHKPEYLQVDPQNGDVYQNIADLSEIAVIDPTTLSVARTIPTPELTSNHPLQLDAKSGTLLVGGENNVLSVYDTTGKKRYQIAFPMHADQCDWDGSRGWLACAGTDLTLLSYDGSSAPKVLGQLAVAHGFHTLAIDPTTGDIFGVWSDGTHSLVQRFAYKP